MSIIRKHKIAAIIIGIILLISITGLVVAKTAPKTQSLSISATPTTDVVERDVPVPPSIIDVPENPPSAKVDENTKQLNVLVLGFGGAGHQGGYLSDVILLVSIDVDKKTLALIHVPRDLYLSIPIGSTKVPAKVNAALAMGTKSGNYPIKDLPKDQILRGAYFSKLAISQITGKEIHYVLGVDFNGFIKAIDTIGGIDVNSKYAWEDEWYPIKGRELELCGKTPEEVTHLSATISGFNLEKQFPCRYETLRFNQGLNHLDGETALKYVRSRHSSTYGGDFARGEKQTAVLIGIMNKLFTLKALDKIPAFMSSLSKTVKTDITIDSINMHLSLLKQLPSLKVIEVGLSTSNVLQSGTSKAGASILLPKQGEDNWIEVQSYINSVINK